MSRFAARKAERTAKVPESRRRVSVEVPARGVREGVMEARQREEVMSAWMSDPVLLSGCSACHAV